MESPTIGKTYRFQVWAKNEWGNSGIKTQSKNVIKVENIEVEGGTINITECKVTFPDGTFNETTKVWMSLGLDNSICPAQYVAITPALDISAESTLRKSAIVQMKSWRVDLKMEDVDILHFTNDTDWNIIKPDLATHDGTIEFRCQEFSPVIGAIGRFFYNPPVVKDNFFYLYGNNCVYFTFFSRNSTSEGNVKAFYEGLGARLIPARFNQLVLRHGDTIHVKLRVEGNTKNFWFNEPNEYRVSVDGDFLRMDRHDFEFELLPELQKYPKIVIECAMKKNEIDREIKKFKFPLRSPRENKIRHTELTLADIKDFCGLVKKIDVIPCDRNDYERSRTDKFIYNITKPKGLALILNNTFKGTKYERKGAEIDVKNMTTLWQKFGCELYGNKIFPKPWESDKTEKEMCDLLREVSKVTTKYSFIVIVVMSHGGILDEKLVFKGSDHKCVKVKEIEKMFFNIENVNLRNIPKFFIFQFCRGPKKDKGTIAADDKMIETRMEIFRKASVQIDGAENLPSSSDIFVAYPTHEEYVSFRDIENGSWFINAITNVFMRQAAKHHVADMLTTVNQAMKQKTASYSEKDEAGNVIINYKVKAMSQQKTSLSKRFYLFPGFPE
ncbi:uncharacterized protein LOC120335726 [Styela clava]